MHASKPFASATLLTLAVGIFAPASAQISENVTLLGHHELRLIQSKSDVWGYASGGVELAIVGYQNGTSFVNVTNPATPVEVAFISGAGSIWRDMDTYQNYCYSVTEGGGGMKIINLANPLTPTLVSTYSAAFSTSHTLYIDKAAAKLYACGTNNGMRVLDLTNPTSPTIAATFNDFYIHDIFVRNGLAAAAAISNGSLAMLDVSNLPAITVLSMVSYPGSATHNAWLTDDDQYCVATDETSGGHIHIFDVSDPTNPVEVSQWMNPTAPATASVHNAYVLGNYVHNSWYTEGLQILDITDVRFPDRAGYYDTFPGPGGGFDGAWSAYPYLPSGNILISDIETGLYIVDFNPTFVTLDGTVTDSATSAPLGGVSVSVPTAGKEIQTVSSGYYRMLLAGGTYDVIYSLYGYEPDTISVTIPPGTPTTRNAALTQLPSGSLVGHVRDTGAAPIGGAAVSILATPLNMLSAGDGSYAFSTVPAGSYEVVAEKFGYQTRQGSIVIAAGLNATTTLDFYLAPSFLVDDLESAAGWTAGVPGDDATTGIWELVDPIGTGGGFVQPEDDHTPDPGALCFVTGQGTPGGGIGENDVDGGTTTLLSPVLDLSTVADPILRYHRWYTNSAGGDPGTDFWVTSVSNNGGATWTTLESTTATRAFWEDVTFRLVDYLPVTAEMRVRFVASDVGGGSVVEAAIDDIDVYDASVPTSVAPPVAATHTRVRLASAPNPFKTSTALRFTLPAAQPVLVDIFDAQGRRVRRIADEILPAGDHALRWDGRDDRGRQSAPGLYFVRFETNAQVEMQKLILTP